VGGKREEPADRQDELKTMGKLKRIMQIRKYDDRDIALRKYAHELGVSTHHLLNPVTGKTNEPELVARIGEVERHNTNVRLTKITVFVIAVGIVWTIVYSVFIYPPKYVLEDGTSLHFSENFRGWIKRAKKEGKNIYNGGAEFELHFILRNKHRGEGDISKPILVITAEDTNEEYEAKPETSYFTSKKVGDNTYSYSTVDLGRTIHVSSYGIVDDFFEYDIRKKNNRELVEFIKTNKDKLRFKIRGHPYKDIDVILQKNSSNLIRNNPF
jgi:hypothetical protein